MMRIAAVDGATTRALRRAVLRPGWPKDAAMHGDDNPEAIHLAAIDEDDVVVAECEGVIVRALCPGRPATGEKVMLTTRPERVSTSAKKGAMIGTVDVARSKGVKSGTALPNEMLPCGMKMTGCRPPAAAYAAMDAEVLPVDTHATRVMPRRRACDAPQVMPLSLKEPVGLKPWCLNVRWSRPP